MSIRGNEDTRRFRRRGLRLLVDYASDKGLRCDYATSLSPGGLFIETDQLLSVASCIKMRFRLPTQETMHEIEGRVAWTSEQRKSATASGMGIAFTDGEGTERLAREIEDLDFE